MNFETLEQVRDFVNSIPEDQFCRNMLDNDNGRRCVAGHLNVALHGDVYWRTKGLKSTFFGEETDAYMLLNKFGASLVELINFNNQSDDGPKKGALAYLDSIISKN